MRIVETELRPVRIALLVSRSPTTRVGKRAFRLLGGRWGGAHDVLIEADRNEGLDAFGAAVLQAADPDLAFTIDPQLHGMPLGPLFDAARRQPFYSGALRERGEEGTYSVFFEETPVVSRAGAEPIDALDLDVPNVPWMPTALGGLLRSSTKFRRQRVGATSEAQAPYVHTTQFLSQRAASSRWILIGDADDFSLAARFWTLRALGHTPLWAPPEHDLDDLPTFPGATSKVFIYSTVDGYDVDALVTRWRSVGYDVTAAPEDPTGLLGADAAVFARALAPVHEHQGRLRFPTPPPPVLGESVIQALVGVASYRVLSPDPQDPGGVILSVTEASRRLVQEGTVWPRRVTADGVAEINVISEPQLIDMPLVHYGDAVMAPLREAGFGVAASDKGRYQQRSLELAGGLRYLAWLLRQPASAHLFEIFFEYHRSGRAPEGYRRAVGYEELHMRLVSWLQQRHTRLSAAMRQRSRAWLDAWIDGLLSRGLLVGGYVLTCTVCADRSWYPAEQVTQRFRCARCATESTVGGRATRSFRMNEAFYQLRHHQGQVVTLALANLRDRASRSFLYTSEAVISRDQDVEVDAIALVDGALCLVEAKSNTVLTRAEARAYRFIAHRAKATRLLFATTSRERPMCAVLDCARCADEGGAFHRDYAWGDAGRAAVAETRERLTDAGIDVKTLCFESLVGQYAHDELESFERRPGALRTITGAPR